MRKTMIAVSAVALLLCLFCVSCTTVKKTGAAETTEGRWVIAIYTKEDAQAYSAGSGEKENLDTSWIYFSDGTFVQFAEFNDTLLLFSNGTYALNEGGDFIEEEGEDAVYLTIKRSQKYQNGALSGYSSEHTYNLGTLGFEQIYAYEDGGKKIEAVFYGLDKQLLVEEDGDKEMLDTVWLYFDDMTFEQYAVVDGIMTLFSTGDYVFEDGGDFIYEEAEDNFGDITISRHQKYSISDDSLSPYESVHTYDLKSLGFVQLFSPEM